MLIALDKLNFLKIHDFLELNVTQTEQKISVSVLFLNQYIYLFIFSRMLIVFLFL